MSLIILIIVISLGDTSFEWVGYILLFPLIVGISFVVNNYNNPDDEIWPW